MITARQLRESNYQAFEGPHLAEQVEALAYIERMASIMNVDTTEWDILESFKNSLPGEKRIITDRRSINKRIHEISELLKRGVPLLLKKDEETLATLGQVLVDETKQLRLDRLRDEMASLTRDIESRNITINDLMREVWDRKKQEAALKNAPPIDLLKECSEIVAGGFWKYQRLNRSDRNLCFVTVNPVILALKNPAAGVDIKVFMGHYQAIIEFGRSSKIVLAPYNENLYSGPYYHPYVSGTGKICWGNAADHATELLLEGKYSEAMQLLSALLTTYSPDSTPYDSLENFHKVAQSKMRADLRTEDVLSAPEYCDFCDLEYTTEYCENHRECDHCSDNVADGDQCQECWCPICGEETGGDCDCCSGCERTDDRCERCRECHQHDGHNEGCSEAPEETV